MISNDTLMAFYRTLLRRCAAAKRNTKTDVSRYVAVEVAVNTDLQGGDTVHAGWRGQARSDDRELLHLLGTAVRNQTLKNRRIEVVWTAKLQDAALADALETARAHKLPILFVAETAASGKGIGGLLKRKVAPGEEMPHIVVDGNDVVASYRVAHEAIERARLGRGPTVIECAGYRVKGQPPSRHLDPVANLENYMQARGLAVKGKRATGAKAKR